MRAMSKPNPKDAPKWCRNWHGWAVVYRDGTLAYASVSSTRADAEEWRSLSPSATGSRSVVREVFVVERNPRP